MSICYVTAYIDIGRGKWKKFKRTSDAYIQQFIPFIGMFRRMTPEEQKIYSMIVFVDDKYYNTVFNLVPYDVPIHVISCSRIYLQTYIKTWSYLPLEQEIIKSNHYKSIVGERIHKYPENFEAEYTVVTTSKVDFVVHASRIVGSDYFCWVDFGYFKLEENIPHRPLDLNKLHLDRINLQLVSSLDDRDRDIIYTMKHAPERVAGAFVFGRRDKFLEYQTLYHTIHEKFHDMGLVDDDQHLALQCYFTKPELFIFHKHYWSKSLIVFQKDN
ncbi:hypothetical protein OAV62_01330 [bacterium]|nr:hypothetical protein [bacterium]